MPEAMLCAGKDRLALVGLMGEKQRDIANIDSPQYSGASWATGDQPIEREKLTKGSKLLALTTSLAIGIHALSENVGEVNEKFEASGLSVLAVMWGLDGTCTALAIRE